MSDNAIFKESKDNLVELGQEFNIKFNEHVNSLINKYPDCSDDIASAIISFNIFLFCVTTINVYSATPENRRDDIMKFLLAEIESTIKLLHIRKET